jgi:hypothetical protein
MAYEDTQKISSVPSVALGSRIDIFPSMPLPDLDATGGIAFAARYKSDAASSLFAIICQSGLPPRLESVQSMQNIDNPAVLRLIEGGVVPWIDGSNAYALVYQRPTAPRMIMFLDEVRQPLSEDAINRQFIAPMIGGLIGLHNFGVVHHGLRLNNIFWRIGTALSPQIGECLSSPAGVGQPILFEPIERALAMPLGRGVGTPADDCYAFGIIIAFLVLGRNPLQGLSDQEIIDIKMQRGSFGAILGNHRLPPPHIEILRGLLADDATTRWTASDLDMWLSGRRMTPKSSDAGRRASRNFSFLGKDYWQIGPLTAALSENVTEAAKVIENESLNKWLRRAMSDKDRTKDVDDTISDLKQNGKTTHYEDQLVARVCITLEPTAPIRYRGISALPLGIPTLLAEAMLTGNSNVQPLSEIIVSQLVSLWIQMQEDNKVDYIVVGQLFERMKNVIEKPSFGNGVERALYEANPSLPCLSPMLRKQFVTSPKLLLPALERIAAGNDKPPEPMDRHIAAFLLVREKRGESGFASMNGQSDPLKRGIALIKLYADLQYRSGPDNLPQLAAWLSPIVAPALQRFYSKALREGLQKQAKEIIASGNLSRLLQLIDNPDRIERDQQDFLAARLLYLNIQKEIIGLESKLNNRENVLREAGKPMATLISSFLAIILVCAALVRVLLSALFF